MVSNEESVEIWSTRYRLGTALVWLGVLTWAPFIILRFAGYTPSVFWFVPFHLLGVVGGARLKAIARRKLGLPRREKTRLRSLGHSLIALGLAVWAVYFTLKLAYPMPVEVSQFLPFHLAFMFSGVGVLYFNFLRGKRRAS